MWRIVLALPLMVGGTAHAQELTLFGGGIQQSGSNKNAHAWAFEYRHPLHENILASFSWLNEGHLPGHHRDGQSLQIWGRTDTFQHRLSLAAGLGPYRYSDTTASTASGAYANAHGWGMVGSLAASYYTDSRWLYQLRFNRIVGNNSIDTNALMLGIGYQLGPVGPLAAVSRQRGKRTDNEVTASFGFTIVNSDHSEHDTARALEYRHGLAPHVDVTVSLLNEGDPKLIRRTGIAAQLWGVHRFLANDRLVLGIGVGPYLAIDRHRAPPTEVDERKMSSIFSAMAAYQLSGQWNGRLSWNRINTDYNRDTDVILFGVGYRF